MLPFCYRALLVLSGVILNIDFIFTYKPVVLIHGVITGNVSMSTISARIEACNLSANDQVQCVNARKKQWFLEGRCMAHTHGRCSFLIIARKLSKDLRVEVSLKRLRILLHPGTKMHITDRFSGWASLAPMWHQVNEIGQDVMKISAEHPEGIHLIGYSQGGLIARAILEVFPQHNVHTFISLSSPQAGQYGTKFLHLFFPNLVCKTAYELFYSNVGQHISVGNYWNDPHHQDLYFTYNRFLPGITGEIKSDNISSYKASFTKLKKMVLIGGPDDGVITPWQSSHFGYFNETESVVDFRDRSIYTDDLFGLKTLDKKGKLKIITVKGVTHLAWHRNTTVIDKYLIPLLD